jgi:uncharacterized Fe-S radical SAM superfamily protein PflX
VLGIRHLRTVFFSTCELRCVKSLEPKQTPADGAINNIALKNLQNKIILYTHDIFGTFTNIACFPVA